MKRSEYIQRAEEARRASLEERWLPILRGEASSIQCPFCDLEEAVFETALSSASLGICVDICPFHSCSMHEPSSLYGEYSRQPSGSPEEHAATQAIVDFLIAFNPVEWAAHLVEIGALSDD
jgi:hypothetical protein